MKLKSNCSLRRVAAIFCVLLLLLAFGGCSQMRDIVSGVAASGEFPVEVNGVSISAKPQKVVVLSPGLADVVLALGYETQLAAVSSDCTQEELSSLTKVDAADPQSIAELSPDLVLTSSLDNYISETLSGAGVTVLEISPAVDREDFERLYAQTSSAFAGSGAGYDKGIATAQNIFTTMDDLNRVVPKEKIVTACYLYDLNGSAVTGDMFGSTIMSYAGVTNIFKSLTGGTYEFESLRVSNPNAIFCTPGLKAKIENDSRFKDFQAVQSGNVYEMDPTMMDWQGRTIVSAAIEISAKCFPEMEEEGSMVVADPGEKIDSAVASQIESSQLEADTTEYKTLQQGENNEEILKMQTRLDELGYLDTEYDGMYGEYTATCVKEFQENNGLQPTGIADAETQRKLYSKSAKAKGDTTTASQPEE